MFQQSSTLDNVHNSHVQKWIRKQEFKQVVFTSFPHVKLGFVPLSKLSSRWRLKPEERYARLKWVEITSRGRSEFNLTQAVVTNRQAQKMRLDWSYTFAETSTRRLQLILNFLGEYERKHKWLEFVTEE